MSKTLGFSLIFGAFIMGTGFGFLFTPEYSALNLHGSNMEAAASANLKEHQMINMILDHHQEALFVASQAAAKSPRPQVREFGQVLVQAKTADIQTLMNWKKTWYNDRAKPKDGSLNLGSPDDTFDLRFLNALEGKIVGALEMGRQVLMTSTRGEFLTWASELMRVQSGVLNQVRQWRQDWYLKPLEVPREP